MFRNIINFLVIIICIYKFDYINCAAVDNNNSESDKNSAAPNFCEFQKLCPANTPKHIGCITDPNIQYRSNYYVHPLSDEHREIVLHRLNSFRDSLAVGNITHFTKSQGITNMRLMMWDNMYQYLSDLMILRLGVEQYGCVATDENPHLNQFKIVRLYHEKVYPVENFLDELFGEITQIIVDRTQPNDATTKVFSYLYNPMTSRIGCSVGSRLTERNATEFIVRCIVDGTPIKQFSDVFQYGQPCEKCDKCSDYYPGLCEPMMLVAATEAPIKDKNNSSAKIGGGLSWIFCLIIISLNIMYYKN